MKYKQGRSFPPTAQGTGLIFAGVGLLIYYFGKQPLALVLLYPTLWIMFSTTSIDTSRANEGIFIRRFGLFPFIFRRKIKLSNYDAGVIKVERVKYRTTQSTGFIAISSQETSDSFMALSLKIKGKYDYEVLFKGTRDQIMSFVKKNLKGTDLRFFNGVLRKEHEIVID